MSAHIIHRSTFSFSHSHRQMKAPSFWPCTSPRLSTTHIRSHSQCLFNVLVNKECICSQLTPLSASTCKLFHLIGSLCSCSRSTRTVVYHFENMLKRAIARNPKAKKFQRLWGRRSRLHRLSNQCATSHTVSVVKHCNISVTKHSAGPLALFFIIFPRARKTFVDCDLYVSALERSQAVTTTSLLTNPCGLDLRRLRFVIIAFFTVGSYFLCPLVSVLASTSVDPEFRDHWLVNHLASR